MKKSLITVLCIVLIFALFTGCGTKPAKEDEITSATPTKQVDVTIAGLTGPSSIGMIKLISEEALNSDEYAVNYHVAAAPDELTAKLINGEIQIAALPTNSAAVLYNKTEGQVQFLALNTLGVLYLVGNDSAKVSSVEDLKGKSITMSGSGGVPQFAVEYILEKAGVKDSVNINFVPDHASAAQALLGGNTELAVLPQPFVTQVLSKDNSMTILLDINKEWEEASEGDSVLAMGCLAVRSDFAQANPDFIEDFLELYTESVMFVNKNPVEAAKLVSDAGIIPDAEIVEKAIPYCNIVYKSAKDAKGEINGFLKVLYDFNPASVGGKLPDEGFYYEAPQ